MKAKDPATRATGILAAPMTPAPLDSVLVGAAEVDELAMAVVETAKLAVSDSIAAAAVGWARMTVLVMVVVVVEVSVELSALAN